MESSATATAKPTQLKTILLGIVAVILIVAAIVMAGEIKQGNDRVAAATYTAISAQQQAIFAATAQAQATADTIAQATAGVETAVAGSTATQQAAIAGATATQQALVANATATQRTAIANATATQETLIANATSTQETLIANATATERTSEEQATATEYAYEEQATATEYAYEVEIEREAEAATATQVALVARATARAEAVAQETASAQQTYTAQVWGFIEGVATVGSAINDATQPVASIHSDEMYFDNASQTYDIKVDLTAGYLQGVPCQVAAYFYYQNGNPLVDQDGYYKTGNGQVAVSQNFTPTNFSYRNTYDLVIPYNELDLSRGYIYKLKYSVSVINLNAGKDLFDSSYVNFNFDNR